ncbi:hypothetical protein V2J09_017038 [Rumex salicifolius]
MEECSNHVKDGGMVTALTSKLVSSAEAAKRVAKEDPRRVVHGVKVGIAVSLVSLFYYLHPLYGSLGESAMWAVLTVVVLFDFSVGTTLGKGVNRMGATCAAGSLAVGAHRLADLCGDVGQPILLLICAAVFTFMRFIPEIKARYDYGLMIFILTFSMVMAGFRDNQVFLTAWRRLVTIVVGCAIAIGVSIFVFPVWSGQELHNLIASNLHKIGCFLEGFGGECIKNADESDKSYLVKYKSVLTTKISEEAMANFARWEPRHGQFRFHRPPWNQYLKIGALARKCAYKIDTLNIYHLNSDSQVKLEQFKKMCMRLSSESGKALKELSHGMKKMKRISLAVKNHIKECKTASDELKSVLNSKELDSEGLSLLDLLPVVTIASILIEIVTCIEEIAEAVQELILLDTSFVQQKAAVDSAVAPAEELNGGKGNGDANVVVVVVIN